MNGSLLVLSLQSAESRESPELDYLRWFVVGQARRVFGRVREVRLSCPGDLEEAALAGAEEWVLLLDDSPSLIGHDSLRAMRRALEEGAHVVAPQRLDATDLGERFPLFTLRGYERAERHFLEGGRTTISEPPRSSLPASLWRRSALEDLVEQTGVAELFDPSSPNLPSLEPAGLFHRFIDYYGVVRRDVLPLVPDGCTSILEIGCARGHTSRFLQEELGCRTVGVEMNPEVARDAEENLDRVLVGDVLEIDPEERFDLVLALELFEHLCDGRRFLDRARRWLRPDGAILLSVPNVGHFSVVEDLVAGRWDYLPIGLLCFTHYRFFTRSTLEDWLRSADLEDFELIPQTTDLPEAFRTWPEGFSPDQESLRTSGFFVVIRP